MALDKTKIIISAEDKTKSAVDSVRRNFSALEKQAGSMVSNLRGGAAALAVSALVLSVRKIYEETRNAQAEQAQLAAVLLSTGEAAGWSREQLNKMADDLSKKSVFAAGDITNAQTRLLSYTGIVGQQFPRAMQATIDMAQRMGMTVEQSAETIGRALDIPSQGLTALTRQGFRFTEAQKELVKELEATGRTAEAQNIILKALEGSYGGAAEAARNTMGGAMQALRNSMDDLFEASDTGGSIFVRIINDMALAVDGLSAAMRGVPFDFMDKLLPNYEKYRQAMDKEFGVPGQTALPGPRGASGYAGPRRQFDFPLMMDNKPGAIPAVNFEERVKARAAAFMEANPLKDAIAANEENKRLLRQLEELEREGGISPEIAARYRSMFAGKKGTNAGVKDALREREAFGQALENMENRLRGNAQRLADDATATELAALQRGFEAKEVSAEAYYGRLQALEEQRVATVLNGLQAERDARLRQLDAAGKESERVNIRAEISDINTQIALAESGLERFRAEAAADLTAARTEAIKQEFAALSEAISREVDTLRVKEQQIAARVALGMSAVQGEQQVNAARRESVAVVGELTTKLEALAVANAAALGPDAGLQVERFKTELAEMSVVADQVALDVNGALNTSLRTMFSDIITGAEDAGEALRNMLKSFVDSLAGIAANRAADSIFSAISGGGGGGIGGFFSGLLNGFAEGGYTGNLGTATPAGVVHGQEFVFSAPAVRALGVGALDHLHRLATGSTLPRAPRIGYSEGGEVNLPQSAAARQQSSVNIINTIDSDSLSNAIFSGGRANRSIINIISAEKQTVRSILGV